jgi:peptidoglycan hydrolase-like protein with peptidoglycan-binding domain
MQFRRASVAHITTHNVFTFGLFLVVTAGIFFANGSNVNAAPTPFLTNYQLYDRSEDIRSLQQLLNTQGFIVAHSGPGSPGNETSIFGLHTYQTLIDFQLAHGLPTTGYFGPLTRAFLNSSSNVLSVSASSTS